MTTATRELPSDLKLLKGAHAKEEGGCVMQWAAYFAGREWTDAPPCVSRVCRSFAINWNDSMNDEDRQMLVPLIPKLVGTATNAADEETRAWMATDWLARVQAPAWLRLAGLTEQAQAIEATARIVDAVTARAAQPALDRAQTDAVAAGEAAGAAAWEAARVAAGAAAWEAAGAAAWEAARVAAGGVAAAGVAARVALRPTVVALQKSALELLEAMCEVGRQKEVAA